MVTYLSSQNLSQLMEEAGVGDQEFIALLLIVGNKELHSFHNK